MRILFICKKNETYGFISYTRRSSGLYNSTSFIVRGLLEREVEAKIIEVIDNNCIDRAVSEYKPDIVIIEALWVVPEKFIVLKKLHPNVKWFVHLHSHIPFLALEGIAMEWIDEMKRIGVGLIANSKPSYDALRCILREDELTFLPNVYISNPMPIKYKGSSSINVGCFGAIRPLKNQLLQALSSIKYANETGRKLRFHINASRSETNGAPVLKNIVQLFEGNPDCELVQHPWHEPEEFLSVLHNEIDIGLQVSLTETFNVVCADYVTAGIPIVTSKEITWTSIFCRAKDDSINDIVNKMYRVENNNWLIRHNQKLLLKNSKKAQQLWYEFVTGVLEYF